MAPKKKRSSLYLHPHTRADLAFAQELFRVAAKNTAIEWCIRLTTGILRFVKEGWVVLAVNPTTLVMSPLDIPGQDLTKAANVISTWRVSKGKE